MILWDILAPSLEQNARGTFQTPETAYSEHTLDIGLRVRTQYTHPLADDHSDLPTIPSNGLVDVEDNTFVPAQMGELAEVSIDDLFTQFPEHDFFYAGYNQGPV